MKLTMNRPVEVAALLLLMALPLLLSGEVPTQRLNGFDVGNASIPLSAIHAGGPPRDGIPALQHPLFIRANQPGAPQPQQRVLGLSINGDARAYPIAILNWHELVNDRIGGQPVLISYCPLCGTGMAFAAKEAGYKALSFGVSGLLYNSDVLMFDRQTGSLWSQILSRAVSGPLLGSRLQPLVLEHTDWRDWLSRHPHSRVLSPATGYSRDYSRNPYASYASSPTVMFPVGHRDARYPAKSWVLGLELNGQYRAYPLPELAHSHAPITDHLGDRALTIIYDHHSRNARVLDADGSQLPALTAYWFAWSAFHPQTTVYRANNDD